MTQKLQRAEGRAWGVSSPPQNHTGCDLLPPYLILTSTQQACQPFPNGGAEAGY